MKLPNWFKILWWVILCVCLFVVLYARVSAIQNGTATSVDAFLFLILFILLLLPLFSEFDLFGIKLKARIEEVKSEVKEQVTLLRNEIVSVGVNTQFNPQIHLAPPPDSKLPELEKKYQRILDELKLNRRSESLVDIQTELTVPADANYLFLVRYSIEKELRRIWRDRFDGDLQRRAIPVRKILSYLRESELVDPALPGMVQEVYSVCSPAIHGEDVTQAQIEFVRDIAPDLISTLIEIQ